MSLFLSLLSSQSPLSVLISSLFPVPCSLFPVPVQSSSTSCGLSTVHCPVNCVPFVGIYILFIPVFSLISSLLILEIGHWTLQQENRLTDKQSQSQICAPVLCFCFFCFFFFSVSLFFCPNSQREERDSRLKNKDKERRRGKG